MEKVLTLTYASSLTDLCEVNSSFDSAILRVAYTGQNRNGSKISKQTFENCLKSIYNCPIVCNYDRDSDSLGGHDMELVRDDDGSLHIVNVTTPVGCIPESARIFWQNVEEDDGTVHEYLCAEALLWKRQEAYRKIKEDGCCAQSMEITVKDGKTVNGVFEIYDFEFTAFALIGVEPCYESAELRFSKQDFKQQLEKMMLEIKENYSMVTPSRKEDEHIKNLFSTEGGEKVLDEKLALIEQFGLSAESLDFSFEEMPIEELKEKLESYSAKKVEENSTDNFALEGNFREELYRAVGNVEIVETEWGKYQRYVIADYDKDLSQVYCWDTNDWLLYGFEYAIDGDVVTIDAESKKRKKYVIADFDEGEQASPFASMFSELKEALKEKIESNTELEAKYQKASDEIGSMGKELEELRRFKADTDAAADMAKRNNVFAQFGDLVGVEAFESLKENPGDLSIDELEEKCFAIRGKNTVVKFSQAPQKPAKLKVERKESEDEEPYGGIFKKYNI